MALQASIKKITPPGSSINGPLTPPLTGAKPAVRVASILRVFRDCQNGATSKVSLDSLYDYDPIQSKSILRMPTILHDTFISRLVTEIEKTLECLADKEIEARPLIEAIKPDAAWPGIVIEVARSQERKSLVGLVDNHILGSYGGIGVVVGLDLDHKKSKEASISVWRLKNSANDDGEVEGKVEQVVDNQLFRDAEGNDLLSPSSGPKLSLKDFAIEEVIHGVPDLPIVIDSKPWYKLLGEAENWDNKTMTMQGAKPPRFKRKWRPQTPPEQPIFSDEEKFVEVERRVRRNSEKLHIPYNEEGVFAEDSSQNSISILLSVLRW